MATMGEKAPQPNQPDHASQLELPFLLSNNAVYEEVDSAVPAPAAETAVVAEKTAVNPFVAALHELGDSEGAGQLARIVEVLELMEVAEAEITAAKARHPEKHEQLHDAFKYLKPSFLMYPQHKQLYQHHARELLERVAQDEKLEPATNPELIYILKEHSLIGPLVHHAVAAYARLFCEAFPVKGKEIWPEEPPELQPGAVNNLIERTRRKTRIDRLHNRRA